MTMSRRRRLTPEFATTLLDILGMILVSVGVWLIYAPAGYVAAGALLLLVSWRMSP